MAFMETLKLYVKTVNREEEWPDWLPKGGDKTIGRSLQWFVRSRSTPEATASALGCGMWRTEIGTNMPTDLIFQEVKSSKASGPYVLIRRPQNRTRDSLYTIGKIRGVMRRRNSLSEPRQVEGWRLELNGQDSLTMQEVADVYLTMVAMSEGAQP